MNSSSDAATSFICSVVGRISYRQSTQGGEKSEAALKKEMNRGVKHEQRSCLIG